MLLFLVLAPAAWEPLLTSCDMPRGPPGESQPTTNARASGLVLPITSDPPPRLVIAAATPLPPAPSFASIPTSSSTSNSQPERLESMGAKSSSTATPHVASLPVMTSLVASVFTGEEAFERQAAWASDGAAPAATAVVGAAPGYVPTTTLVGVAVAAPTLAPVPTLARALASTTVIGAAPGSVAAPAPAPTSTPAAQTTVVDTSPALATAPAALAPAQPRLTTASSSMASGLHMSSSCLPDLLAPTEVSAFFITTRELGSPDQVQTSGLSLKLFPNSSLQAIVDASPGILPLAFVCTIGRQLVLAFRALIAQGQPLGLSLASIKIQIIDDETRLCVEPSFATSVGGNRMTYATLGLHNKLAIHACVLQSIGDLRTAWDDDNAGLSYSSCHPTVFCGSHPTGMIALDRLAAFSLGSLLVDLTKGANSIELSRVHFPRAFSVLMARMCSSNPDARLTLDECDAFLEGMMWSSASHVECRHFTGPPIVISSVTQRVDQDNESQCQALLCLSRFIHS